MFVIEININSILIKNIQIIKFKYKKNNFIIKFKYKKNIFIIKLYIY